MGKTDILKTIDGAWFVELQNFIANAIFNYKKNGIPAQQIEIYMPAYILAMWQHYLYNEVSNEVHQKFMDVKIYPNYQNNVVVSYKEIHFTKGEEPKILHILEFKSPSM